MPPLSADIRSADVRGTGESPASRHGPSFSAILSDITYRPWPVRPGHLCVVRQGRVCPQESPKRAHPADAPIAPCYRPVPGAVLPSRRPCQRSSTPALATGLPEPPATGAAPNAPSPRTRTLFPSLPAVVRTSPAAGPLPCLPCRTAPSLERCPQGPPSPP